MNDKVSVLMASPAGEGGDKAAADPLQQEAFALRHEEGHDGYRSGGYHPVRPREEFHGGRYVVARKLGWGHFSTVWAAVRQDTPDEGLFYALKIVKSAMHYTEAALDEIEILKILFKQRGRGKQHIVALVDHFYHRGPHGTHVCMVFEPLRMSLLDLIKAYRYKGIPLPVVKKLTRQILLGLDYLHSQCRIIHTDLKPENIMLTREDAPPASMLTPVYPGAEKVLAELRQKEAEAARRKGARAAAAAPAATEAAAAAGNGGERAPERRGSAVKIVDFGSACFIHKHYTNDIQTRQYRSIEAIVGANYSTPVDMWSLGCIVFELATGDMLFEPKAGDFYEKTDDHLAQFIETLGAIPKRVALSGKKSESYFFVDGSLKKITKFHKWPLVEVLKRKYGWEAAAAEEMAAFILPCLDYDPLRRVTAREALKHPWLKGIKDVCIEVPASRGQ